MDRKEFLVTYGSRSCPQQTTVTMSAVRASKHLTPRMATSAARIACGHRDGVTVWSNDEYGYRLYGNGRHRKVFRD